jgi:hypothetical protein
VIQLYAIVDLDDDGQPEALLVLRHQVELSPRDEFPGDYWLAVPALPYPERLSVLIDNGATFIGMSESPADATPARLEGEYGKRQKRWVRWAKKAGKVLVRVAKAYAKRQGVAL